MVEVDRQRDAPRVVPDAPPATYDDAAVLLQCARLFADGEVASAMAWALSDEYIGDYERFMERYPRTSAGHGRLHKILSFYETVGTLWRHGLFHESLLLDW